MPQIRSTVHHPNPAWLREHLVVEIRQFEARAQEAGVPSEAIIGARYCLCTALDEAAALTPWGGSVWSSHSLLVSFHNETWGGEKFFHLLERLSQQPRQHLDLLELLSVSRSASRAAIACSTTATRSSTRCATSSR